MNSGQERWATGPKKVSRSPRTGLQWRVRLAGVDDARAIADIESALGPEPVTESQEAEWIASASESRDYPVKFLVATDSQGSVRGWAHYGKADWIETNKRFVYVAVEPSFQNRGIGGALFEEILHMASEDKERPSALVSWCRGYDDASYDWARRRGFVLKRQRTESVLDLRQWNQAEFSDCFSRVRELGLEVMVLSEHEVTPYLEGMYQVFAETINDAPFISPETPVPSYEEWLRPLIHSECGKVFALALDGSRVVGMSSVFMPVVDGQSAQIDYTGVLKRFRGKGIGFAVKVAATNACARRGAKRIRTQNDDDNPAILRLNERLGFKPVPGPRLLEAPSSLKKHPR